MSLPPVRRAYVDGRYGQLHFRQARPAATATREPLLCFHSSPNSGRIYHQFLPHMARDRVVIAVDTPGFGYSDPPASAPSIEDYAGAMGDLMDALGLDRVDVMGYHTGSEVGIALALARPAQVRHLVMISAPIFTTEELDDRRVRRAVKALSHDGSHLVELWSGHWYWAGPGWTSLQCAEQFADAMRRPDVSWWGHNAAFNYPTAVCLAKVEQPVLVLNPDDDLHEQTKRAEPLLRNGRLKRLPGWGHGFLDLHSGETADLLRGFLDGSVE
jgi:pimeloyl-ACP methyl ester carboxylesterase